MPELRPRVRIESVNTVVLRYYVKHVGYVGADRLMVDVQGLGVDMAIKREEVDLAKAVDVDVARRQGRFLRRISLTEDVVMVGEYVGGILDWQTLSCRCA